MTDQNLTDLSPYVGTGWTLRGPCGYYIHKGRVYLQGALRSDRLGDTSASLFTGLPAAIRPLLSRTITTVTETDRMLETPDLRSRTIPLEYSVTVDPSGTISLDALPGYVNTPPPDTYARYTGPSIPLWTETPFYDRLELAVVLAGITWPLPSAPVDIWTGESLAAYLSTIDFTNIDAEIAVHGSRVHLSGHVRANRDGAGDGQHSSGTDWAIFAGLPSKYIPSGFNGGGYSFSDNDFTMASSPRGRFAAFVGWDSFDGAYVQLDTDSGPSLGPPTPAWRPPPTDVDLSPANPWQGIYGLTGRRWTRRHDMGNKAPYYKGVFSGSYNSGVLDDETTNDGTVGILPWTLSHTLDLNADVFAHFVPWPPDWVALRVTLSAEADEAGVTGTLLSDASFQVLDSVTGAVATPLIFGPAPTWQFGGWLSPVALEYGGDPANTFARTLWRPGEINSLTFQANIDMSSQGSWRFFAAWDWTIDAVLFWERRRHYLRAGDILDLTGAGWQVPFTPSPQPPLTPGSISPGPGAVGHVRLG